MVTKTWEKEAKLKKEIPPEVLAPLGIPVIPIREIPGVVKESHCSKGKTYPEQPTLAQGRLNP